MLAMFHRDNSGRHISNAKKKRHKNLQLIQSERYFPGELENAIEIANKLINSLDQQVAATT
jgi:hypothetical protein